MRTRSPKALPLDDDLIDKILTFLPSFTDLRSAVLSSNTFYGVFSARPSSIVEAIAYNEVGPALPEALRVFRYKVTDPLPGDAGGLSSITCAEARSLTRNAAVVKGLEGLYSSRHVLTSNFNLSIAIYVLLDIKIVHPRRASSTLWSLGASIAPCTP